MPGSKLDQIVKGVPASNSVLPSPSSLSGPPVQPPPFSISGPDDETDPLTTLPSSPPQIYLNLLILEASLRSQYVTLRARRRQHSFFLFLLSLWIAYFFYALFLRPREDGRGVGGSVYWVVEMTEKVALMGGIVTAILVWGTGQWERGIRWPRRWVGVANRGLRTINVKVVVIKGPWWSELLSTLAFLSPYASLFPAAGASYNHYLELSAENGGSGKRSTYASRGLRDGGLEESMLAVEDITPGGDIIRLLLLPKSFSPDFRENWELYRMEYWEKENERRGNLRHQVRRRYKELARQQGGWFWWIGWRGWSGVRRLGGKADVEKTLHTQHSHHAHHHHQHNHHHHHQAEKDPKRRSKTSSRSGSLSRASSRSTTPTHELEERPTMERMRRRSSNASSTGGRQRKTKSNSSLSEARTSRLMVANLRSNTAVPSDPRPSLARAGSSRDVVPGMDGDELMVITDPNVHPSPSV